jgi:hypothetical protein
MSTDVERETAALDVYAVCADLYDGLESAADLLSYLLSADSAAGNLIRADAFRAVARESVDPVTRRELNRLADTFAHGAW